MRTKKGLFGLILTLLVTFLTVVGVVWADDPTRGQAQRQRFNWVITKRLNVSNLAIFSGDVEVAGDVEFGGGMTVDGDFTVEGDTDLYGDITSSEGAITMTGLVQINGERDAVTGRDNFLTIEGDIDGMQNNANTRGLLIEVERPATAIVTGTNLTDYGLMVRIKTKAITTTAGPTMYGADIEAKTDDNAGWSTLRGVQATAVTDAGGLTNVQTALRAHAEVANTAFVTTTLQIADFELNRKDSDAPANEWGINIRNTSNAGTGADVALRIESSYGAGGSAATDLWDYGIDMSPANIGTADIRLSQGETIDNSYNGIITMTATSVDVDGNLIVIGSSDLQGNVADSLGLFTIADNTSVTGNITVTGDSNFNGAVSNSLGDFDLNDNLDVNGTLVVTSTSDLMGNVSDSGGVLTIADNVLVDGQDDVIQFTVQADSGQTANSVVVEHADGVDAFTISPIGNTMISGTLIVTGTSNLRGDISDAGGNVTIADDLDITGALDVQGGNITLQNDETIDNSYNGIITMTATSVDVAGNLNTTGALDVQGGNITLENDETIDNSYNGIITMTVTRLDVSGAISVTGASYLQGDVSDSLGNLTVADDLDVDGATTLTGQADVIQLTITGEGTQSADLVVLEHSDGTDAFTVSGVGNTTISGTLIVTGTSNLRGDISDAGGNVTVADDLDVTGALDVQGGIVTLQNDETIDNSYNGIITMTATSVDVSGILSVTGASYLQGDVSDASGVLTIADALAIVGQVDAIQLTITGEDTQSADLMVLEHSDGTDAFTVSGVGNTTISGTLIVTGTSNLRGDISDAGGDVTIADNFTVTQSIGLNTWLSITPQATVAITEGESITVTGSYVPLAVDGEGHMTTGNPSITDGAHVGDLVILINEDASQNIVIADNQNCQMGGNVTLTGGDYDSITLIWNGTDWIALSVQDN